MRAVPAPPVSRAFLPTTRAIEGSRGVTLIELLVTLAVAAIVLTIGLPSFQNLIREARATSVTNQLLAFVHHTRSEAVRRGAPVTLCASADGTSCMTTDPDFTQGWVVVSGYPGDPGSEVLRVHQRDSNGIEINANFGQPDALTYVASGETRAANGALLFGNLQICHSGEDRRIIISSTGRPRTTRQPCSDG